MAQPTPRKGSVTVQSNDLSTVIPIIDRIRALAPSDPEIHKLLNKLEQTCQAKPKRNRKAKSTAPQAPAPPTSQIDGKTVYEIVQLLNRIAGLVDKHWGELRQVPGILSDLVGQLLDQLNLPSF